MAASRAALFGGRSGRGLADMGTTNWGDDDDVEEPENTRYQSVQQIRKNQYQLLEDQDRDLEALSEVITRQKNVARVIGDEVDHQNDLIEDITDHVERTRDRLVTQTNRVTTIDRKDATCGYWTVILILFIAIVLLVTIF